MADPDPRDHPRFMGPEAHKLAADMIDAMAEIQRQVRLGGLKALNDDGKAAIGSVILLLWSINYPMDDD